MIKKNNIHKYRLNNIDSYYMSKEFNRFNIFYDMINFSIYRNKKFMEKCNIIQNKNIKMLEECIKIHIDDKSKNK